MILVKNGKAQVFGFELLGGTRAGAAPKSQPEFDAVLAALDGGAAFVPLAHEETPENANKVRTNFGNYAKRVSKVKRGTRVIPYSTMPDAQQKAFAAQFGVKGGIWVFATATANREKKAKAE